MPSAATEESSHSEKTSSENSPEEGGKAESSGATEAEHESDVRVITRAVYRINGGGYLDPKHPQHLWVITAPHDSEETVKPRQLTSGKFEESNIIWSKDGGQIFFTTTRVTEPYYELPSTDIYSITPTGGEPAKVLSLNLALQEVSLSPDGKRMAFCA